MIDIFGIRARRRRAKEEKEWWEGYSTRSDESSMSFCSMLVRCATTISGLKGTAMTPRLYDEIESLGNSPTILSVSISSLVDRGKVVTVIAEVVPGSAILRAAAKTTGKVFETREIRMWCPPFGKMYDLAPQP